eukprot:911809-Rhodomonas_salina.1
MLSATGRLESQRSSTARNTAKPAARKKNPSACTCILLGCTDPGQTFTSRRRTCDLPVRRFLTEPWHITKRDYPPRRPPDIRVSAAALTILAAGARGQSAESH